MFSIIIEMETIKEEQELTITDLNKAVEQDPLECEVCGKLYKNRSGIFKHRKSGKCKGNNVSKIIKSEPNEKVEEKQDLIIVDADEELNGENIMSNLMKMFESEMETPELLLKQQSSEKKRLAKELKRMVMNNPSIDLEKPVASDKFTKIDSMSVDELEARILDTKMTLERELDMRASDGVLSVSNQVIGGMLSCQDELSRIVSEDQALRKASKEVLSRRLLCNVPYDVKALALYSMAVAKAKKEAYNNQPLPVLDLNEEKEEEKE